MPTALLRKGAVTAILGMEGCMSKRRPPPFLEKVWIPLCLWREAVHLSLLYRIIIITISLERTDGYLSPEGMTTSLPRRYNTV